MDYSSLFEPETEEQDVLPKRRRKIKLLPIILGVILLPILVIFGWFGLLILRPRLEGMLRVAQQPTRAEAAPPVTVPAEVNPPSLTSTPVPTATLTEPTATQPAVLSDCLVWSNVTLDHLNQKICVQGDYISTYQRDDGTYVMVFSEEPGTFQVWSYPKAFEWYMQGSDSNCVVAHGWIQTSGVRPMIMLGSKGTLEVCP